MHEDLLAKAGDNFAGLGRYFVHQEALHPFSFFTRFFKIWFEPKNGSKLSKNEGKTNEQIVILKVFGKSGNGSKVWKNGLKLLKVFYKKSGFESKIWENGPNF